MKKVRLGHLRGHLSLFQGSSDDYVGLAFRFMRCLMFGLEENASFFYYKGDKRSLRLYEKISLSYKLYA